MKDNRTLALLSPCYATLAASAKDIKPSFLKIFYSWVGQSADTGFYCVHSAQNFLAPHPKLANKWGATVLGGALAFIAIFNQ